MRDEVRLAMLARATAPFWMEFRGLEVGLAVGLEMGLGMRRRGRQRRRGVATWSAVGTGGARRSGGLLRQGPVAQGCARFGKREAWLRLEASGCRWLKRRCRPRSGRRGRVRLRATTSVQRAFEDAPFAFAVTYPPAHPRSCAAVLGSADAWRAPRGELGVSR